MEKLSDRDRILLGCTPRDPFGALPAAPHSRSSDVDFHDVFGGPPRRRHSSVHESRGSLDYRERGSSSRLLEKPVFGESCSPARRRHLGDDFFNDIFPGRDSDRDPFPSSPGSRTLSPTRPLPPRCEPFGGSSLPAQLRFGGEVHADPTDVFSMKLAKGIDQPSVNSPTHHALYKKDVGSPDAFGFPSSPNASMHSLTTRAVPVNDDLRNDAHAFYRQSPLSHQISHDLDKSLEATDSASLSMEGRTQKDPTSLEGYISSDQFHFSIYKWEGKGVTLIMPSNAKEKNESRFRRLPEVVLQGVGLPSDNDNMPIKTIESKSQNENQDIKLLKDLIMDRSDDAVSTSVEELLPAGFESRFRCSDATEQSDAYNGSSKKVPVTMHEERKPEMKNLRQLSDNDMNKQGNEDIVRQVEETENFSRGQRNVYDNANAKQQPERENGMNHVDVVFPSMQDVQVSLEDKMLGGRVKGKVKEFIKIFNHEASPKHKGIFETKDRRSREKDGLKSKVKDQVITSVTKTVEEVEASSSTSATNSVEEVKASSRTSATNTVEEVKASSRNSNDSLDNPIEINQNLKAEKPDSAMCSDVHTINDSSPERKDTSGPFSESTPEIIDASVCDVGESHLDGLEGCLVEPLSIDQIKHLQTDSNQDQVKISDAKIREWSKGKEGNIRSLLSTLQYVLWPESGWKPIPLVDIIEGAHVKRAYQKALLCLHPDKLQQKGAFMHQKYIAEKVFDILQEAWDHFNSISSF